jgi:tetratricopeptide (TPR) repeat protein
MPEESESPRRTLVLVFLAMAGLFVITGITAGWYRRTQVARAKEFFAHGSQLEAVNKEQQAIEAYQNALTISRDNTQYRLAVALSLMKLGKLNEAAIYFDELLRADPAAAVPNLMLARISASHGAIDRAVDYYHRAVFGYWPPGSEQKRTAAQWELVDLLRKRGTKKQVLAELMQLEQLPNDDEGRKRVANLLLTYGAPSQASEIYRDILRQNNDDAQAWAGLGEADLMRGRYLDAQSAFRRAARRNSSDEPIQKRLDLANAVVNLDPGLRGLSPADRFHRSQVLLRMALSSLDTCLAARGIPIIPQPDGQLVARARKAAGARFRRAAYAEAVESNISLAERLWGLRTDACGSSGSPEALARVLARLSQ